MNPAFPDQVLNGILLCLCIQLMLLGIYKIWSGDIRSILLGAVCFILGSQQLYSMYWIFFKESMLFSVLLANYKNMFFGPLIYLYVGLLAFKKNLWHQLTLHLALPTSVFLFYTSVKHIFTEHYLNHYVSIITGIQFLYLVVNLVYLVLGIYLFKRSLLLLKPKVQRRYALFYFGLLGYFLLLQLFSLISPVVFEDMESVFAIYSRIVLAPSSVLIYAGVSFFVIIESNQLKSLFLGETLLVNQEVLVSRGNIKTSFQAAFLEDKLFKNLDLSLSGVAEKIKVSERVLAEFIRNEYGTNFQDLTNSLRVAEFKSLCQSQSYSHLNLSGIAHESGFASKSTFYRVFKKKEGVTPNEYVKSLNNPT